MIRTENNTLLPSRIVTRWRICIDYRKLNKAIKKISFPTFVSGSDTRPAGRA